ncbi:cell wall-binding repeat-containing protein [Haloimpatiens sp. FM7330]|uniref:cell wall-binding repeat-containing protein n=1 Tax=Haloimpatiens sp. FM7330 TaxID=3298610 RepID=UPI00362B97D6
MKPKKNLTKLAAMYAAALMMSCNVMPAYAAAPDTTQPVEPKLMVPNRLSGRDRYETSVQISKASFKTSKCVVIACGESFPDAICSVPLAKKCNAPVLLSKHDTLPESVEKEILRLKAEHIIMVGGDGALSKCVESKLKGIKTVKNIERIFGKDRYDTSLKIAEKMGKCNKVVIATGNDFADALSIAPIAAIKNMPVILSKNTEISDKSLKYIKENSVKKSYIIGGKNVINKKIENQLGNCYRIYGKNRYETNIKILKSFYNDVDFNKIYISKGDTKNSFADALTGGAAACQTLSPMILTKSDKLPETSKQFLKENLFPSSKIILLGGEKVVNKNIENEIIIKVKHICNEGQYDGNENKAAIKNDENIFLDGNRIGLKNFENLIGDIYIKGSNIDLDNIHTSGNIYINKIDGGRINLNKVQAKKIIMLSGDNQTLTFKDSKVDEVSLYGRKTSNLVVEKSSIKELTMGASANIQAKNEEISVVKVEQSSIDDRKVELKGKYPLVLVYDDCELIANNGNVDKLKVYSNNMHDVVKLQGHYKNVEVMNECNLQVKEGKIDNLSADSDLNLEVDKNAEVGVLNANNNKVNTKGEGKINEKLNNDSSKKDSHRHSGNSNNDGNKESGEKVGKIVLSKEITKNIVKINASNIKDSAVTIVIYEKGSDKIVFLDQVDEENFKAGKVTFEVKLDKGSYHGAVNGIKAGKTDFQFNINSAFVGEK